MVRASVRLVVRVLCLGVLARLGLVEGELVRVMLWLVLGQ